MTAVSFYYGLSLAFLVSALAGAFVSDPWLVWVLIVAGILTGGAASFLEWEGSR